jgi:hypothetical protein
MSATTSTVRVVVVYVGWTRTPLLSWPRGVDGDMDVDVEVPVQHPTHR